MVLRVVVALWALALICGIARAEDKPWADGVDKAQQDSAMTLYGDANVLFEKGEFLAALEKYDAALEQWKHPAIHYNKAMCLIQLDRPLEAYEQMEKAMKYGEAPLGKELFREGKNYLKVLGGQVATLKVELESPGATVKLDGTTVIQQGTTGEHRVVANREYTLIAEKPGYKTKTVPIKLEGGKTTTLVLKLELLPKGRTERRWARWVPWSVVAVGGAAALIGAPLLYFAKKGFEDFDRDFAMACSTGCPESDVPLLVEDREAAERKQKMAYGAFAVGGATVVAGIILVVLNQPRLVGTNVRPTIGTEHAGAVLSFTW